MAKDNIPPEIMELAKQRQEEFYKRTRTYYGNNKSQDQIRHMFDWSRTPEKYDFWRSIILEGEYEVFYEKYPEKKIKPSYEIY